MFGKMENAIASENVLYTLYVRSYYTIYREDFNLMIFPVKNGNTMRTEVYSTTKYRYIRIYLMRLLNVTFMSNFIHRLFNFPVKYNPLVNKKKRENRKKCVCVCVSWYFENSTDVTGDNPVTAALSLSLSVNTFNLFLFYYFFFASWHKGKF